MSQAGIVSPQAVVQAGFKPNQTVQWFDDFMTTGGAGTGLFSWTFGSSKSVDGTSTNPGLINFFGGASNSLVLSPNGANTSPVALAGGTYSLNWVMNLVALSTGVNTYTMYIGLGDYISVSGNTPPINGCYFKYTHSVNGGSWQIETIAASVATTANTITAASTGYHNYQIQVNAAGTAVHFFIDGIELANSPISTHIPTAAISPMLLVVQSAGSVPVMLIDLVYSTQTLTTAR